MLNKNKYKLMFLFFVLLAGALYFTGCSVKQITDISKYEGYKYVASKNTEKFHTRDCYLGKRIAPNDAVFFNSRSAAINEGFKPDKVCEP